MGEVAAGAGVVEARRRRCAPNDAEAQYGVGTFIWQILSAHGGGPDMAAYDPRPRAAPEDADGAARVRSATARPRAAGPAAAAASLPATSRARRASSWPTRGSRYLEKALALRPRYPDAMTYLALLWRQKSFAFFADPTAWQQAVDRGERVAEARRRRAGREELTVAFEAFRAQSKAPARAGAAPVVRAVDGVPRRADRRRDRVLVLARRRAVAAAAAR